MASSSSASGGAPRPAGEDAPHQCLPLHEAHTEAELTAAIRDVYARHAPERIGNVPAILHKYQGQLHETYAHILVKYGLAPSSVLDEKP